MCAFEILKDDVDGVVCLIDALQFHDVAMAESAHQFYLVFQGIPAFLACELFLLGKGLHCYHLVVAQSFSEVYCGKSTFPDFSLGLEQFVEVALVDALLQLEGPSFHYSCASPKSHTLSTSFSFETQAHRHSDFLVSAAGVEHLKFGSEVEWQKVGGAVSGRRGKKQEVVGEGKLDFSGIEEKGVSESWPFQFLGKVQHAAIDLVEERAVHWKIWQ